MITSKVIRHHNLPFFHPDIISVDMLEDYLNSLVVDGNCYDSIKQCEEYVEILEKFCPRKVLPVQDLLQRFKEDQETFLSSFYSTIRIDDEKELYEQIELAREVYRDRVKSREPDEETQLFSILDTHWNDLIHDPELPFEKYGFKEMTKYQKHCFITGLFNGWRRQEIAKVYE